MSLKVKILLVCTILVIAALGFERAGVFKQEVKGEIGDMNIDDKNIRKATFAGGCFWCVEADFEKVPGVVEVVSGFAGGEKANPTYKEVSSGTTGHVETVQVYYDPSRVTYEELLEVFWKHIDPTDPGEQRVSEPPDFVTEISEELGMFYTAGFQEDHKARSNKVFNDEEYLAQVRYVLKERRQLLRYALENYDDGLLFFYFSGTDLQAHIFWWEGEIGRASCRERV